MASATAGPTASPLLYYAKAEAPHHDKLGHPECAARGSAILEALDAAGLTERGAPGQASTTPSCPAYCLPSRALKESPNMHGSCCNTTILVRFQPHACIISTPGKAQGVHACDRYHLLCRWPAWTALLPPA